MLYHYNFVISAGENVNYNVKLIKSNRKNYDNGTQSAKQRPYYGINKEVVQLNHAVRK